MPARNLPVHPSLERLRKRAKEFRDLVRAGHQDAVSLARELHPRWATSTERAASPERAGFTLADAQLVVAR